MELGAELFNNNGLGDWIMGIANQLQLEDMGSILGKVSVDRLIRPI